MADVIGIADGRGPLRLQGVADITQLRQRPFFQGEKPCGVRLLVCSAILLMLSLAPHAVSAQVANQCTLANTLPIIASPADTGWLNDNAAGITHTPTLNGNQASTRYGIQTNGAIVVAGELQWNNPAGPNSGRATMEILVNGVRYATLFTSEAVAGMNSTAGEFWPDNGSLISIGGAAETGAQQAFVGNATSTGRTYRSFTVRLPTTVAQVTSVQYVYQSNYSGSSADDDIRYRNIQINQCKATLRLQKQIVTGRESGTDQFALSISSGGLPLATTTTTGTGTTVNNGLATLAPFNPGVLHTLSEAAAGTADLSDYTSTYSCTNASSGTGTALPSGTGTSFSLTPASGDDITCTLINTRRPVTLTLTKVSQGGVGSFTFTGDNGWTSQTLTTSAPGTGVNGSPQALAVPLASITISEVAPPTFRMTGVVCSGMGAGGTVSRGVDSFTLNAVAVDAGNALACTITNTLQQADLQVVKTASPNPVVSGDVVTYTLVVSNNGPSAASNVLLTDSASAGQTCTTPSTTATCTATGGASCPSPTVPVTTLLGSGVTIPSLPAGGQVSFILQCTVTASGQ